MFGDPMLHLHTNVVFLGFLWLFVDDTIGVGCECRWLLMFLV